MATFDIITAESFAEENPQGEGRKRQRCREAVSCLQCRQKKVKCDRSLPCNQCKIRKIRSKCTFTQTKFVHSPPSKASARNHENRRSAAFQPHAPTPRKHFQEDLHRHETQLLGLGPRSTDYLAVPFGKDWTPVTNVNELGGSYVGHQLLQPQLQSPSWPMLTPHKSEPSQPTSAAVPFSPVECSGRFFSICDIPNRATANSTTMDSNGLSQYDLSMNSDMHLSQVHRQNDFLNDTNDTDAPRGQLPAAYLPHSFPDSTMQQNTFDASSLPPSLSAAVTMHMPQPTTLINNQLLTDWVDDEGVTDHLPWNSDANWNGR